MYFMEKRHRRAAVPFGTAKCDSRKHMLLLCLRRFCITKTHLALLFCFLMNPLILLRFFERFFILALFADNDNAWLIYADLDVIIV
jgi:hypothetical protein